MTNLDPAFYRDLFEKLEAARPARDSLREIRESLARIEAAILELGRILERQPRKDPPDGAA